MAEDVSGAVGGSAAGFKAGAQTGNPYAAAIGAIAGLGIGLGAGTNTKRARTNLENTVQEYMNQLANLDMPRYEDLKLSLERYAKGDQLNPEQLQALQELDSEVSKIAQSKTSKQAQLDALAGLKARARGGLTLQDKANLLQAQQEVDRQQSGVQKSIMQNMQARGVAGGGQELAAKMIASQGAGQVAAQNSLQVAANAQNNAMQALKDQANLGRQIGQDQMDFDKMKAQSVDDTRRRNLERLQQSMVYNIGNKNAAQQANLNRANQVGDANVNLSNDEQQKNKKLLWDDYQNQINQLNMIYSGKIGQKQGNLKRRQDEQAGYMDAINSLGSMGSMGSMFGGGDKKGSSPAPSQGFDPTKWTGGDGGGFGGMS